MTTSQAKQTSGLKAAVREAEQEGDTTILHCFPALYDEGVDDDVE